MSEAYSRRDFITGVLVCGTVTTVAVGLSRSSRPARSVELRLLTGRDDTGARSLLIDMWNRANPQTRVVLDIDQGETGDQRTHMQAAATDGGADIVNLDTIHLKRFIDKELITPVEVDDESLFVPESLLPVQRADHNSFWAVPFNTDVGLLFERVTEGEPEQGRKSLNSVMRELAATSHQLVGQLRPTSAGSREAFVVNVLEHALSQNPAILNTQGFPAQDPVLWQNALQPLRNAIQQNRVITRSSEGDSIDAYSTEPRPRYMRNWPVAFRTLQQKNDPDAKAGRLRVHPVSPGILGGQSLAVARNSAYAARAMDVIRFLTGTEAQKVIAAYGLAPTRIAVYNDKDLPVFIPHLMTIRGAVEGARSRPPHVDYPAFRQVIFQHVSSFLSENVDLSDRFIDEMRNALR